MGMDHVNVDTDAQLEMIDQLYDGILKQRAKKFEEAKNRRRAEYLDAQHAVEQEFAFAEEIHRQQMPSPDLGQRGQDRGALYVEKKCCEGKLIPGSEPTLKIYGREEQGEIIFSAEISAPYGFITMDIDTQEIEGLPSMCLASDKSTYMEVDHWKLEVDFNVAPLTFTVRYES